MLADRDGKHRCVACDKVCYGAEINDHHCDEKRLRHKDSTVRRDPLGPRERERSLRSRLKTGFVLLEDDDERKIDALS